MMNKKGFGFYFLLFFLFSLFSLVLVPMLGSTAIFPWNATESDLSIFWRIRVPEVLVCFLVGGGLGICGMAFQGLFRNPLASPFTLGVSSGAAFSVALALIIFSSPVWGLSLPIWLFAALGAFLSMLLIMGLACICGRLAPSTLLLGGVALNFFFAGAVLLLQNFAGQAENFELIRWMMGDVTADMNKVVFLAVTIFPGLLVIWMLHRRLDLMLSGETLAITRGMDLRRTAMLVFLGVTLVTGSVVATCGPIGFVGLMAPHFCRPFVGNRHSRLTPVTFLAGGTLLVWCDLLARWAPEYGRLPIGVVTNVFGAPFFLVLLLRKKSMEFR